MKTAEGVLCIVEVKDVPDAKAGDVFVVLTINGHDKDRKKEGQLQLPGGGIEEKETMQDTIQREIYDELNIEVDIERFIEMGTDIFIIEQGYKTKNQIKIIAYLMFLCLEYKEFETISNYTSSETKEVLLMNLKDIHDGLDLRPGTLSHIQQFRRLRMQRATS